MSALTHMLNDHMQAINTLLATEINRQADTLSPSARETYMLEAQRCTTALDNASESLAYWIGRLLLAGKQADEAKQ